MSRLDGDRFKTVRPFLGDAAGPLWTSNAAFLDSAGAWWFLTEKRLYRFDRGGPLESLDTRRPSAVYHTGPGFNNGAFYRMWEDSRGRHLGQHAHGRARTHGPRPLAARDRRLQTVR